jgi:hypothetical protein
MDKNDKLRHRLIAMLVAQNNEKTTDAAIILWGQMSAKIISIVGESGFNSLYVRSVLLSASKFSWLATYNPKTENTHQFTQLKLCLEKQTSNQIVDGNIHLLIALTDILASLIGEPLTTNILCMAWGNEASDFVLKESNNE